LKQDGRTIDEYIDDFYQLVAWNDLLKTKEYLVARHLSELQ
jgi:biotin operon repressor